MGTNGIRVAVVGAGIAGLTVAVALRDAGVHCEVFEQASEVREVGAGIQIAPNAARPLHRLGLAGRLAPVVVRPTAIEMRRWDDNQVLLHTALGECEQLYGAPYYTMHRADLHQGLLELLPADIVHLKMRCAGLREQADGVELSFAGGATVTVDAVVGADGIHSMVRGALLADQPRFSGQAVYRGLVPAGRLAHLFPEPQVRIWLGPGQHCVCYPVSAGELLSFAATTPAGDWRTESWTAPGRVEDLVAAYSGWHDAVREVLLAADTVSQWAIYDRDTVECWSTDRITLAGDAAHPMLPFGAQGASQAIEDAVALAACLESATVDTVAAALRRYEKVRRPRTTQVHRTMRENARNHHYSDGDQQRDRDRTMTGHWGLRAQEWLYGYDATTAIAGYAPRAELAMQ